MANFVPVLLYWNWNVSYLYDVLNFKIACKLERARDTHVSSCALIVEG